MYIHACTHTPHRWFKTGPPFSFFFFFKVESFSILCIMRPFSPFSFYPCCFNFLQYLSLSCFAQRVRVLGVFLACFIEVGMDPPYVIPGQRALHTLVVPYLAATGMIFQVLIALPGPDNALLIFLFVLIVGLLSEIIHSHT